MASISQDISIQVNSTLNREADFTLLGGTQDPSNGQANAKTLYEWDLSAESLSNCTTVKIEASTVDNPTIIEYSVVNQDGDIPNLQVVVNLLNTLNLGTFNLDGNVIFILDDINVFGTLSVLISQDFDIDDFVETGYNYFDSEGKTTLASFSSTYKDIIQHAINTIPTFVEFIETQGWSLAFVFESSTLRFNRSVSGDVYHISDNLGTLTTTKYSGTNNINTNTFQKSLLFVSDINIFTTCTLFEANALTSVQSVIYKYVFGNIFVNFNNDSLVVAGWKPLSPNYFPTINGTHIIKIDASDTNVLDDYGNSFPSVNQINTSSTLNFIGVNSGTEKTFFVGTAFADAELNFGNSASISTTRISKIESLNGSINVNFATLIYNTTLNKLDSVQFKIFFGDSSPQNVTLDSAFNEKFRKTSETDFNALQLFLQGTLGGSNFPQLIYADDTTPLQVNVDEINFRNTYTPNLPPIQVLGGYDGSATVFNLDLDIQYQANPSNISMRYFNDWFYKVGTQDAIYNQNIVSGTRVIDADNNNFILSGSGIQGYQSLFENGYTQNLPVGAIIDYTISFTIIADPFNTKISGIRMTSFFGLGNPTFEVTTSEKGQNDSVLSSTSAGVGFELLQFPSNNEDVDVVMTTFPTVSCNSVLIGETASGSDQFKRMYIGKGLYQFPLQNLEFTVFGLTLTMPIYDAVANEVDAIGLYQRNFNGAWGGTNATFKLSRFKINGTNIGNPSIQPFNSGAIINLTAYTSNFSNIEFNDCIFGTDLVDNTLNNILNLLLPSSAFASGGISFQNCTFNGVDSLNPYLQVTFPLGSLNVSSQALNGTSRIINTIFSQSQPDRILFTSNWDGNPTASPLNILSVGNNTNLEQINLQNSNTATPNALTLSIVNNSILEVLNFTNHNITNLIFSNNPLINNIDLSGNNLSDAEIDDLLNEVNSYGTSNGTLNYSAQTGGGEPTAIGGGTAYNNLISRGWTIIGASPFGIDISTFSNTNNVSLLTNDVYWNWLDENGTLMYRTIGVNLEKFGLLSAFDISTYQSTPIQTLALTTPTPNLRDDLIQVYDNGNYLFHGELSQLRRREMTTPNDLTTIVNGLASSMNQTTNNFGTGLTAYHFNPTGTKIYGGYLTPTAIVQYDLTSAWDLTTLTNQQTVVLSTTFPTLGITSNMEVTTMQFDSTGTTMLIFLGRQSYNGSGTTYEAVVYQFSLSSAYDFTTASYTGVNLNVAVSNRIITNVFADSSITKLIGVQSNWQLPTSSDFPQKSENLKEYS